MNRSLLLVALLVPACGSSSSSTRPAPATTAERADLAPVRESLDIYTDGKGHLVALVEPEPEQTVPDGLRLFYGDGKTFHSVPVWSATSDGLKFDIGFEDPRIPANPAGSITREEGKVVLSCYGTEVPLSPLPEAEAQAMVGAATFLRTPPERSPLALVHDGDEYLYVDLGDSDPKYRVYGGKKGAMREIAVKDARYDEHENQWTFLTSEGTLLAMRDPAQPSYTITLAWKDGGKKRSWASLDRAENWKLIYEQLGVYRTARTPTPCDPMMP